MQTANLSVVLPTYNHAHYLPRALDAILAQSLPARELVVVDDASTDDTPRVIEGYARRYPSIRVVRNETNLGVVGAMNRGAALAAGEYLGFSAADDYILPGFYEKAVALLDRYPQAGLCTAFDSFQVGDDGPIEPNPTGWSDPPGYFTPDEVCRRLRHSVPGHATLVRRAALNELGWFAPDLAWYCDWFALVAIAFRYGACHIPEPVAVRVLLPGNYSAAARTGGRHVEVLRAFFARITSPEYGDVAPYFRRNGTAAYFGPDLVRAAADRPDCWSPPVLGFLNGFTPAQYRELLADPDPVVRELGAFFLGPFWKQAAAREEEKGAEVRRLRDELNLARSRVPPFGIPGKFRWLTALAIRRLRRSAGLGVR
ncbi:MAG: hypothetical protein JWO38_8309 [Gemmataceae bacterium]|nr:hypothetical protein [Gemmataceae bacterium]